MQEESELDHLVEDLFLAEARGDSAALARLAAAHPEYEHQLTAYAVAVASLSAPLSLSQISAAASLDTAELRNRALAAAFGSTTEESVPAIAGILARAAAVGMDTRQLAVATDLPRDVLVKLDRRLVAVTSVPKRCLTALADALDAPVAAVRLFLAGGPGVRVAAFNYAPAPPVAEQESFASALASSPLATREQQATWHQAIRDEGLA